MLFTDPGDGIKRIANDVEMIKLHGFTVTLELSVFYFFVRLLHMLKECLLSFLTIIIRTFHIKSVSVAQEGELSSKHAKLVARFK